MDRITELYAKTAHEGQTTHDLAGDLRGAAALAVLAAGIALNVVLPFAAGWWLLSVFGFR